MINAIIIGCSGGAVVSYFLVRRLLTAVSKRLAGDAEQQRWIKWLGGIFGAISLAPGMFLSMMFGGVIGGSYDQSVAEAIGLGATGPLVVLAVRITLVTVITVTANAMVGAGFGFLVARGLNRQTSA
jgi:hypothetical protein